VAYIRNGRLGGGKLPKRWRSGPNTAARKIASRAARVGRQTARDPGFSDQLQLWGLAQVAWNDACCLARSCEPLDQSNGLCFRTKWTSRPLDPAFSGIPGPKQLDIQQTFPVGIVPGASFYWSSATRVHDGQRLQERTELSDQPTIGFGRGPSGTSRANSTPLHDMQTDSQQD